MFKFNLNCIFVSVLTLTISATDLFSNETPQQITSPTETLTLLETIKKDAIVIGNGTKEFHSFIDPLCSLSQKYVEYLYQGGEKFFSRYKIYLYLYELKRKNSANIIKNILESQFPETTLKALMVDGTVQSTELNSEVDEFEIEERVSRISTIAEKIGVYKRPFIITNGKGN